MRNKISKLELNYEKCVALLGEYQRGTTTPTFRGFLLHCGITRRDVREMEDIVNASKDPERSKYYNVLQLLEDYKDELEVKMEEYMIYQQKHPDMKDYPDYNYKNLEFVLRASNPRRYSQSNVAAITKKQETMKILENKSKVKLDDSN